LKRHGIFLLLFLMGLGFQTLSAQVTLSGGKGQLRLVDAEPVVPGHLYVNAFYNIFVEKHDNVQLLSSGRKETRSILIKDNAFNLNVTLGLFKFLEIFLHTVPYQDNQHDLWGPIGDTQTGFKLHVHNGNSWLQPGLLAYAQFPTAPSHEIPYETFTFDHNGWALMGLLNMDLKNTGSARPFKLTLNLGYRDSNWLDRYFADQKDQLLFGAGFKFPFRGYQLYSEVTGEMFVNQRETHFRQNPIRFSQGLRLIAMQDFIVDVAADIKLGGYRPTSEEVNRNPYLRRYADWKLHVGASYRTTLFTPMTPDEKVNRAQQNEEKRKLDEIRKKREQVTKELEDLKKSVEKEKKEKQPL
jgi:hypothetical protein